MTVIVGAGDGVDIGVMQMKFDLGAHDGVPVGIDYRTANGG